MPRSWDCGRLIIPNSHNNACFPRQSFPPCMCPLQRKPNFISSFHPWNTAVGQARLKQKLLLRAGCSVPLRLDWCRLRAPASARVKHWCLFARMRRLVILTRDLSWLGEAIQAMCALSARWMPLLPSPTWRPGCFPIRLRCCREHVYRRLLTRSFGLVWFPSEAGFCASSIYRKARRQNPRKISPEIRQLAGGTRMHWKQ